MTSEINKAVVNSTFFFLPVVTLIYIQDRFFSLYQALFCLRLTYLLVFSFVESIIIAESELPRLEQQHMTTISCT